MYKPSFTYQTAYSDVCKTYHTILVSTTIFLKVKPRSSKRVEDINKLEIKTLIYVICISLFTLYNFITIKQTFLKLSYIDITIIIIIIIWHYNALWVFPFSATSLQVLLSLAVSFQFLPSQPGLSKFYPQLFPSNFLFSAFLSHPRHPIAFAVLLFLLVQLPQVSKLIASQLVMLGPFFVYGPDI